MRNSNLTALLLALMIAAPVHAQEALDANNSLNQSVQTVTHYQYVADPSTTQACQQAVQAANNLQGNLNALALEVKSHKETLDQINATQILAKYDEAFQKSQDYSAENTANSLFSAVGLVAVLMAAVYFTLQGYFRKAVTQLSLQQQQILERLPPARKEGEAN